jgi:hypothetical protein
MILVFLVVLLVRESMIKIPKEMIFYATVRCLI